MILLLFLVITVVFLWRLPTFALKPRKGIEKPEINHTKQEHDDKTCSYGKKCLMTEIEKKFFAAIKCSVSEKYTVFPQINLATIVKKQGDFRYQNELYRNIDFGIFDKDYNCVLLVEINDATHNDPKRRKRDIKVKEITQAAEIPLITFYTKYGVNQEYIAKRIKEII